MYESEQAVLVADDQRVEAGQQANTANPFLSAIHAQESTLIALAEKQRNQNAIIIIRSIATDLRSQAEEVFASGVWRERQQLEKDIDKMPYTLRQLEKGKGKEERRNRARDKMKS